MIIGTGHPFNAEYFYSRAFRKIGHEVEMVDEYEGIEYRLFTRIINTRTRIFSFSLERAIVNRNLEEKVSKFGPDIIIIFKGEILSDRVIERLSESYSISLFWPDMYKFKPLLKNRINFFDNVFTAANKIDFYKKLGARRVTTVPWACDPEFHRVLPVDKVYNVSFIGTAYPERRKVIRSLGNVDVFGDFWFGFGEKAHGYLTGDDFVKVINESKINLNLQAKTNVIADAPTMRTFEVAGSGGFQVSDYLPSIGRYFPKLPTFKSTEELKELRDYYLDNKPEREESALDCFNRCRDYFKYTDSAKLILSSL